MQPVSREQNVVGLDVAMDHAVRMRIRERGADLAQNQQRGGDRHRPRRRLEALRERLAIDEGHDEEDQPIALIDRVDRHDVRVRELCGCLGFLQEPAPDVRPEREIRR